MGWEDYASNPAAAVGSAAAGGVVERNWAKRDAERDRTFEREMVQRQEEFQTTSATTAHNRQWGLANEAHDRNIAAHGSMYQRSMADMKKAGLNPMLAYSKGAGGMPGASTPSSPSPTGAKGVARGTKPTKIDLAGAAQSGSQAVLNTQQIEVAKANIRLLDSSAELNSAKALQVARQTEKTRAETVGQLSENKIAELKADQRKTTGDSPVGRFINTVLRTGKMGYVELEKLARSVKAVGKKHRYEIIKFLKKHGWKGIKDGKSINKKTIRQKHTRRHGGPR